MAKLALSILIGFTILRYWICLQLPPSPTEAYLYLCARHLDTAFFDGPAGPATLVAWGNKIFTNGHLALRWISPLFAALATVASYILGKRFYGIAGGLGSALLISVLPSFQLASIRAENTLPALAFWFLALLCIWNASRLRSLWWWVVGGVALALGLQFSYWLLLAPLSCLFYILSRRSQVTASSFLGWGILILFCIAALIGPLEWHIRQQWLPFKGWTWQTLFEINAPGKIFLKALQQISVPAAILGLFSLVLCFRNARLGMRAHFLSIFTAIPLICWFLIQPNEAGLGLLTVATLFIWLGGWWQTASHRGAWFISLACSSTAIFSMWNLATSVSFSDNGKVAAAVKEMARIQNAIFPSPAGKIFFIGETPSIVCEFEYAFDSCSGANKQKQAIFLRESPNLSNQFRLWPSYCDFTDIKNNSTNPFFTEERGANPYLGRSALYITSDQGILPQTISAAFQKITPLQTVQVLHGSQILREFSIYFCSSYQTLPL